MQNVDRTLKAIAHYRPGGLLRCCIQTIHEHNADGQEGERLACRRCKGEVAWKDGAWQWPRSPEPLTNFFAAGKAGA